MKSSLIPVLFFILFISCSEEEYPGVVRGNVFLVEEEYIHTNTVYDDHSGIRVLLCDINGTVSKTLTDKEGNYEILNVRPGDYKLRFEKDSFSFYEMFNINIEGADTIEYSYPVNKSKSIRLKKLKPLEYKIVDGPYIDTHKGTIPNGPYQGQFGLNYEIVVEIEESRPFGCIAFISTEEDVDFMNYQMAVHSYSLGRYGVENKIMTIDFSDLDREIFPLSTKIFIHYYPYEGGTEIHDPWLNIDKFCTMHYENSRKKSFTIPGNSQYYEGSPLN